MKISDQVAMVTGGGSGLGRSMALGLARDSAKILIAEVRRLEGERVVEEIRTQGGEAELFVGDISQENVVRQTINFCIERFKRIDILINNAGLRMESHVDGGYETWRRLQKRLTHELSVTEWDLVVNVNLRGTFLCTHFALPQMIRQRMGTIISISSTAGNRGVSGKCAYCASKHAIEGLMKTVAEEVRDYGISANSIHPGGGLNSMPGGNPDMMVPLVLFLARQDKAAITGQTISALEWNKVNVNY
jgi:3-oxoacyl-[acyl-carrier protein] reductase